MRNYGPVLLVRKLMTPPAGDIAMASIRVCAGLVIAAALSVAPLWADQGRRRADSQRGQERTTDQADRGRARAVPRSRGAERQTERQDERRQEQQVQRQEQIQRQNDARQYQAQRQYEAQRRRDDDRRYDNRRYDNGRYSNGRDYRRPEYSYRGYGRAVPRVIRPRIVTVIPYRPYVYRPRLGIGVYYGAGGSYPYGYTPRGYYDPVPGRLYGGLRITGAPHEAHVFADGYYVGIVDDFDGVFQHLNLEAGPHRIEVEIPGYDSIAFDVMVQPGRTTTFRADLY
jgi:hypothetical protein